MNRIAKFWSAALLLAVLCLAAGAAEAQLQSGNLYGKTVDEHGAALPGVSITLSGQGAPQTQVSDAEGAFHFLGLSPGSYALKSELQGFSTVDYPNIVVNVGRNTTIEVSLTQAVEDVITVTAESPLLDSKRISTGNTVSQTELAKIPTARDPWAVLQSTPGVLTDRINVGGNESGQQSNYVGPGSGGDQAVWALDGVVITDMSAIGSSPGYFDFDAFEEMQVTTGGSDASIATGGVVLNMVTKRGTNEWRGSGRYNAGDKSTQSDLAFDRGELAKAGPWRTGAGATAGQTSFNQGNRINKVEDYGAELGGPVVKDRLWIWGSYSKTDVDLRTIDNFQDHSILEDWNAKLNWQITPANSATFFGWDSSKTKIGRNAGPLRPQETTWNQGDFGPTPAALKVEDTQIFGANFFLTGMYSKVNGGFVLAPHSPSAEIFVLDPAGVFHHQAPANIEILRPQRFGKLDGSTFFSTGSLNHELRFGAGYRTVEQSTLSQTINGAYEIQSADGTSTYALARDSQIDVKAKYASAYAQDTLTTGNLTANVGLRYDRQTGTNVAASAAANAIRPDLLPAVNYRGGDAGFTWTDIAPRLGLTYGFGADRKTLLRLSYSRFADQLASGWVAMTNPVGLQSYAYFYGDSTGNGTVVRSLVSGAPAFYSANVDPRDPSRLLQSNAVAPDLRAPTTDELLLGVEHALAPEFVVGLDLRWRKTRDLLERQRLVFDGDANSTTHLDSVGRRHRRSDYRLVSVPRPGGLPDGSSYTLNYYELVDGVTTRNGYLLENSDREQDFKGASAVFTKRLSNRWMMRGNVSWQDWTWSQPASANIDPTQSIAGPNTQPGLATGGVLNGAPVLQSSGTGSGSKGSVFVNSTWSYSLNALYQVAPDRPWGFNVAGNLTGRQGYPIVRFARVFRSTINDNPSTGINIPVTGVDRERYADIRQLDLRLEKDFNFADFGFTLGVDCFNVTNQSTVLQRNGRLRTATSDNVQEIVSPRIFRLGLKLHYR